MTQGSRVGAAAGSSAASSSIAIPANARKVVQDLQEIVKISEEEIYAMLKECNMDPNETVQRLLNQDTFHEVKRRHKKKENLNKELGETRVRTAGVGSSMRGGRPRARGNYAPRYNSEFSSGGRGQAYGGRDNGTQQNGKNSNLAPGVPVDSQAQVKPVVHSTNENGPMATTAASGLAVVPNGSSQYTRVVQAPRASVGPGQATMADIVKSSAANHANAASAPLKVASQQPLYPPDGSLPSASDHVLHSYVDSLGGKQNLGTVGLERSVREFSPSLPLQAGSTSEPSEQGPPIRQLGAYRLDAFSSVNDGSAADSDIPSTSVPSSLPQELISSLEVSSEGPTVQSSSGSPEQPSSRAPIIASLHGRMVYQSQPQTLGSEKGSGLEWRPKSPVKAATPFQLFTSVNEAPSRSGTSQDDSMELFLNSTSKLQQLSIHGDQPVIIPDHLQVPEADRTHLNFGSFGEDFETNSNFVDDEEDDDKKSTVSVEDSLNDEETTIEQPPAPSLVSTSAVSIADSYKQQPLPSPVEALVGREDVKINMPAPVALPVSQPEVSKPETLVQQSVQHPILSSVHGYAGSGAVPQLTSGQFTYEAPETQTQEVSRPSSFVSYSDPSANANYYNPVFRPSPDLDARYAQFVSASSNKYGTGIPQMTGQGLSSSQEGGNSIALPTSGPAGQTSQAVSLSQSTLTIPQQHIPIQAYPSQHAGVPLTPFGANVFGIHFVPQSYGYTPPPYQHSYSGHGHTPLPQAPDIFFAPGSSYGAAGYPSSGAVPMKYAFSQYKPGGAAGNAPHTAVAAGYGNFSTSPSGFTTINSAVTSASASGYEDASGQQYKESNLFIPSQQPAQGSGVWIQNPPSRDMTGMQTNSYYNLLGQGQHTSFAHTQPMHAVPAAAYASLYNQSQSGSAPPAVHQLLQQPQALGAVGGVGTQSGAYQQQRQLNWPPNY
ncbi:hypothetical protein GOP47_0010340 [Adiantum capillus-veneris]|uniref:GBF-interacting protein 1 N-terminal domain-containing protein n=1 Tax=Adiantum capillus-veneris TaxID=13818 RepID=A0A9D4ZGB1_ADICA|nr:hypothetical protein GOP47_0010340 [Adiantum capillus-veneris]